jgi:hypothetical protein
MNKLLVTVFVLLYCSSLMAETAQTVSISAGTTQNLSEHGNVGGLTAVSESEGAMLGNEVRGLAVVLGALAAVAGTGTTTTTTTTATQ